MNLIKFDLFYRERFDTFTVPLTQKHITSFSMRTLTRLQSFFILRTVEIRYRMIVRYRMNQGPSIDHRNMIIW